MDHEVPDSTDWLNTVLQPFAALENALHCQVCKEFYDTPMLTSCSHTFCSKCIRRCLSADGRCPACRATDQASKLRNNWALQEVVAAFLTARPAALDVARREKAEAERRQRPGKRKRAVVEQDGGGNDLAQDGVRTTRSRSKRIATSQSSQADAVEVVDSEEDADFEPEEPQEQELEDGFVECPLGCGKRMKIEAVEPHLDRCEDERKQSASREQSHTSLGIGSNPVMGNLVQTDTANTSRERLAGLNYSLMTEAKLRTKLKELGIPNWGAKQLMVKRHVEWLNLWNANCDSSHPRTKRALLHDLETWERTQGGRAANMNGAASTVMRKDFDGAGWASRNRDEFSRLIADARRTKANPASTVKQSKSPNDQTPSNAADGLGLTDGQVAPPVESSNTITPPMSNEVPLSADEKNDFVNPEQSAESETSLTLDPTSSVENGNHQISSHRRISEEHQHPPHPGSPCALPEHLAQMRPDSPNGAVKKLPMFAMPQHVLHDVNDSGGRGGRSSAGGIS